MTEKMAYSVSETAEALGVAPNTIYSMVAKKQIPFRKLGYRIIIPVPALIKWLETATENVRVPDPVLIEPAYAKPPFDPNTPSSPNPLRKGYWQTVPGCGGRKKKRKQA
jgi:excisionase family DNA binding protein